MPRWQRYPTNCGPEARNNHERRRSPAFSATKHAPHRHATTPMYAVVVPSSKSPASRVAGQHAQLPEEAGLWRSPAFSCHEARSESPSQKPGFFALPDHDGTTRTRSCLRIQRSVSHRERRGRPQFKKPGFARGGSTRATHGRSRALAKPGFFSHEAWSASPSQKPGFFILPDHDGTTRTRSCQRIQRSVSHRERRGRPQFKKPGFARGGSTRATPGRSRALAKPGFFMYEAWSASPSQKPGFFILPDHDGTTRTRSCQRIQRSVSHRERRGRPQFMLPDHDGTTRTRSCQRIQRSVSHRERRGRLQFKKPGFARGGSTRATHGRSRALAASGETTDRPPT